MIESAGDAIISISSAGLIESWNEGAERLYGYTEADALGQSLAMLTPPHRAHEPPKWVAQLRAGKRLERVETERLAKDGRVLNVLLSASPIFDRDGKVVGAVGIHRNLSAQRQAETDLHASERRYHSVVEALSEGIIMQELDGSIVALNKSAEQIIGAGRDEFATGSVPGLPVPLINADGSPVLPDELPTVVSMRTGEPQHGVVMGVESPDVRTRWISINSRALTRPGENEPYAAVASFRDITELRHTSEELNDARHEDLKRLALVSEYRDDDTNRHTERVARTAELLAVKLGLASELSATIHRAAPLHDVGKIGIPDNILLKPGKLTAEEYDVIKTHTVIGARILSKSHFPVLQMAMQIALTHHERWDGSGYPAQLEREAIPISGRIVAVADAFDAMTHTRPYKSAFSIEHAVAEIKRCSATQFDPKVVGAFMTLDHHQLVDTAQSRGGQSDPTGRGFESR